jgi:hypothetical protein
MYVNRIGTRKPEDKNPLTVTALLLAKWIFPKRAFGKELSDNNSLKFGTTD